jgi:formylglycine-generating enzyme required for sulfatase activity
MKIRITMNQRRKHPKISIALATVLLSSFFNRPACQEVSSLEIDTAKGFAVTAVIGKNYGRFALPSPQPLFSFEIENALYASTEFLAGSADTCLSGTLSGKMSCRINKSATYRDEFMLEVVFGNLSGDTTEISNVVPFGVSGDHVYITATGPWALARARLFRPGLGPVGVILPDNTWEMGYASVAIDKNTSVCAIARRNATAKGEARRYRTILPPGATVTYDLFYGLYDGAWQNGLKLMFHDKYLYDLGSFDETLFNRGDLSWIRKDYLVTLQFAWDHQYYDVKDGRYHFEEFLKEGEKNLGGYDVFAIWPTWPALGADPRNQWDLFADLPGGLTKMKELSQWAKSRGTKFFISFNPWDQSTRKEHPFKGMARIIQAVDADGVVLDCQGWSSKDLQRAADSVRAGVIMYSEGMAVTKDMTGIIAGRVHDAIYLSPPLNLNKLIRPDFAIFRVCQLCQGRIHREIAISLFNGYGVEMNIMGPGRPDWMKEEYDYLGKAVMILRQNSSAFNSREWTPLLSTLADSIWVNEWPAEHKTLYTVYSLLPEGFDGPLFEGGSHGSDHYVSLWNHEEIVPDTLDGTTYVRAHTEAFDRSFLGTRMEASVDVVAAFPSLLAVDLGQDILSVQASRGDSILIWKGDPAYGKQALNPGSLSRDISLCEAFGRYEGKLVVQLFEGGELADERVAVTATGRPRLISKRVTTPRIATAPEGMVYVPAGKIVMKVSPESDFIAYPKYGDDSLAVGPFFMDRYPVTNEQFYQFLTVTGYKPADSVNFLKHWRRGNYPAGSGELPVVYVGYEDAQAYAQWARKRLPTEVEWQWAAQGGDGRLWPWGMEFDKKRCNNEAGHPTLVNKYPRGASPFGVMDLVGNVWQLTDDLYDNGSNYYIIMRGGSWFNPTSSWWYVKGGPQPLNKTQMLLRVAPSFERNSTVGFRCVKDAE